MRIFFISLLSFFSLVHAANGDIHDWKYLYSESFKMRYVLAKHMLQDCNEIIEIGAYKTPISDFIEDSRRIVIIDPLSEEKNSRPSVEIYKQTFGECDYAPMNPPYGVVLIGMDLEGMSRHAWKKFFDLLIHAESVVIGHPYEWQPSIKLFNEILKKTNKKVTRKVLLDFSDNDFGDLTNSWPPRVKRMLYLLK